jgi:hypothetical protein
VESVSVTPLPALIHARHSLVETPETAHVQRSGRRRPFLSAAGRGALAGSGDLEGARNRHRPDRSATYCTTYALHQEMRKTMNSVTSCFNSGDWWARTTDPSIMGAVCLAPYLWELKSQHVGHNHAR